MCFVLFRAYCKTEKPTDSVIKFYIDKEAKIKNMKKYVCTVCGFVYDEAIGDPDNGIAPGTKFEDLPQDYVCPLCGVGKDMFEEE